MHYIHHLAQYIFAASFRAEKVDQFTKFLHLDATIDSGECPTPSESCTTWRTVRLPSAFTASSITGKCASAQQQVRPCPKTFVFGMYLGRGWLSASAATFALLLLVVPLHGPCGYSPAVNRGETCSIRGHVMWLLSLTKWHWDRLFF
jgi:hypothetical protein